jgi:hypothetical protein
MDWTSAIAINREALARIVAGLLELVALQAGARLPLSLYRLVARVLLPAESAVRRLIVIAARGLVVPPLPARSMAKGLVIAGRGSGPMVFPLFDARKKFSDSDEVNAPRFTGPRIRILDEPSPQAQFLAKFEVPGTCSAAATLMLRRRLAAIKFALDSLPRQARRMVRWRARRAAMETATFKSPLRPGAPPGRRTRSRDEIEKILRECHALAREVLRQDTS